MGRVVTIIAFVLAAIAVGAVAVSSSTSANAASGAAGKKRCRIVIRKVHHHTRRIKKCHRVPTKPKTLPAAAKIVARLSLGTTSADQIDGLTVGGGSVWAALDDGRRIVRIDPATMHVSATITNPLQTEWAPTIAYGEGAVWLADAVAPVGSGPPTGALVRIDPVTNAVVATIPTGRSPEGLAFTPGAVWSANHRSDQPDTAPAPHTFSVSKVEVASNLETKRVVVETRGDTGDSWQNFCCGPQGATAGAGSVWAADTTTNQVSRIDPATGSVIATISNPTLGTAACGNMAADATSVWLTAGCDRKDLWRIDPDSNTVASTIRLPGVGSDVQIAFGSVWVSTYATPQAGLAKAVLARLDPATNKVVAQTPIPYSGQKPLATGDAVLWMGAGSTLLELRPA